MASPLSPPTKETFLSFHSPPSLVRASPSRLQTSPSTTSTHQFPKRAIPAALGKMSSSSTESDAFSDDPVSLQSYSNSHSYPAFLAHHGSPLSSPTAAHPISLLTALLNSQNSCKSGPERKDSHASASTAAPSTVPSPISSSGWHPKTAPILRRGSASASSDGVGIVAAEHGLGFECGLEKVVEKRERIGWADGGEVANVPLSAPKPLRACTLKFAVACTADKPASSVTLRRSSASSARPQLAPFADAPVFSTATAEDVDNVEDDDDEVDDDEDDEDEDDDDDDDDDDENVSPSVSLEARIPSFRPCISEHEDDEDVALDDDLGYQEDEEDGFTSEEDVGDPSRERAFAVQRRLSSAAFIPDASQRKELKVHVALPKTPNSSPVHRHAVLAPSYNPNFPFARPTNYRRRRRQSSATPDKDSAPALIPAPPRRGRGHIQVIDVTDDKGNKVGCSRHCSPPPVIREKTRSVAPPAGQSPSARKLFSRRVTSESPRRAGRRRPGSPMPPRLALDENEYEVEEVIDVQTTVRRAGGWRSDDSLFTPSQRPTPFQPVRKASLPPAAATTSHVIGFVAEPSTASPRVLNIERSDAGVRGMFRRASIHIPGFRRASEEFSPSAIEPMSVTPKAPSSTLPTSPTMSPSSCVPAVDDTPATCTSLSTSLGGSDPLAQRLHRTLGTQPASVTRAVSLGSKITFAPLTSSADERSRPVPCPVGKTCRDGVLRWPGETAGRKRRSQF